MRFLTYYSFHLNEDEKDELVEFYPELPYVFHQYNPETEESSTGFVYLPQIFEDDQYLTYEDDYGNINLISKSGSETYRCTGTCVCEEDDHVRRTSGTVISRGIVYLLAAISSTVAFQKAGEYFQEECRKRYSKDDACVRFQMITDENYDCERVKEWWDGDLEKEDEGSIDFMCVGHCLPVTRVTRQSIIDKIDSFNCQKLSTDGVVTVDMNLIRGMFEPAKAEYPKRIFQARIMMEFCQKESEFTEKIIYKDLKGRMDVDDYEMVTQNLCLGGYSTKLNPNIVCQRIY